MNSIGPVARTMRQKLEAAFAPERLEVVDDSDRHAGHAGTREGGESHFNLTIVAASFEGLSRVERQRRINGVLKEELAGPVHALSIKAQTPSEATA
jgi:BolA protein